MSTTDDEKQQTPDDGDISRKRARTAREIDVIRQDRALHLVNGMFVLGGDPNSPRKESKQKIQGHELNFRYTPMSGYDLRLLHGLTAMASGSIRGESFSYDSADRQDAAESAWLMLGKSAREFGRFITILHTTKRQLAEVVSATGYLNGDQVNRTYESLKRLSEVTIHMRSADGRNEFTTQLINGLARQDDRIVIALNPRIVAAVTERTGGGFSVISMIDVRSIRSEAAMLLYNRLCGFIDAGKQRQVSQDRLEEYIWGNILPDDDREGRKGRRKSIVRAMRELATLTPPWKIQETVGARGTRPVYNITRPSRPEGPGQIALDLSPLVQPPPLD